MRIPTKVQLPKIMQLKRKGDPYRRLAAWIWSIPQKKVTVFQCARARAAAIAIEHAATPDVVKKRALNPFPKLRDFETGPRPTWKKRDGEVVPIASMSTAHIHNVVAMLQRKLADLHAELARRSVDAEHEPPASDQDGGTFDPRDEMTPGSWDRGDLEADGTGALHGVDG